MDTEAQPGKAGDRAKSVRGSAGCRFERIGRCIPHETGNTFTNLGF
jgi:hypothetical protein